MTSSTLASITSEFIGFLRKAREAIPIAIHGPFHDLFPGSIDPYIREATIRRYVETLELAKAVNAEFVTLHLNYCLLYTSPSPRDRGCSRMPSSA